MFTKHLINRNSCYKSFEYFWDKYHEKTKQYKKGDKSRAEQLWSKMFLNQKIRACKNIEGCKVSAFEYLKTIKN